MGSRHLLAGVLLVVGCARTFNKEAVQPNPLLHPNETLRSSETIQIVTHDMDLKRPAPPDSTGTASPIFNQPYPLVNKASFTMVSRDRLRFHVQVDHKWEEYADLKSWDVQLIDDRGRIWRPEAVEHARHRMITSMWDWESRTTICDSRGRDATGDCYNTIGWDQDPGHSPTMHQPLGSLSIYRGNADFVFYDRDLVTPAMRWVKLTVKRSGSVFEYVWRFEDEVAQQ
jgi:hypothetical protein